MKRSPALLVLMLAVLAALPMGPAHAATDTYHQPVWFRWDRAALDVLIFPTGHGQLVNGDGVLGGLNNPTTEVNPVSNSYLRAQENAIRDWKRAIAQFGPSWLANGLSIDWKVVGRDVVTPFDVAEADVIITFGEFTGPILGVTFSTQPCLINNSKAYLQSYTYPDMYNISAHEFGHCLGLDHSFGTPQEDAAIRADVIHATYEEPVGASGNPLHCMSNLNVRGVQNVFLSPLAGTAISGSIPVSDYQRVDCSGSEYTPAPIAKFGGSLAVTGSSASEAVTEVGVAKVTPPVAGLAPFVCRFPARG